MQTCIYREEEKEKKATKNKQHSHSKLHFTFAAATFDSGWRRPNRNPSALFRFSAPVLSCVCVCLVGTKVFRLGSLQFQFISLHFVRPTRTRTEMELAAKHDNVVCITISVQNLPIRSGWHRHALWSYWTGQNPRSHMHTHMRIVVEMRSNKLVNANSALEIVSCMISISRSWWWWRYALYCVLDLFALLEEDDVFPCNNVLLNS